MADKRAKVIMLPAKGYAPIIKYGEHLALTNSGKLGGCVQHLYFISDEEIKKGDWFIHDITKLVLQDKTGDNNWGNSKKIVATTDKSLRIHDIDNDGYFYLPQPSQAFIEKYCQVGGIDEVLIEYGHFNGKYNDWRVEQIKIDSHNTITIHPIKNSWNEDEMCDNMQYYMEYCQSNKYVTPKEWLQIHKHF